QHRRPPVHAAAARGIPAVDGSADPSLQALHGGPAAAGRRGVRRRRVAARRARLPRRQRRQRRAGARARARAVVRQLAGDRTHEPRRTGCRPRRDHRQHRSDHGRSGPLRPPNVTETRTAAPPATPRPTLSAATRQPIAAEVAKSPNFRTALLPSLKLAQREIGWLPPPIAAEVADLVGVSHAAANELATFYSMLHTEPHGRLAVEVCVQLPCGFCGGERLLAQLERGLGLAAGEVRADGALSLHRTAECMGACHRAPMVRIGDHYVENLKTQADVDALCKELLQGRVPMTQGTRNHDCHPLPGAAVAADAKTQPASYAPVLLPRQPRTTQVPLAEYQAAGGYAGLRAALQKQPGDVIEIVKQSNLRGRGGAAFPAGLKWSFVPKGPGPKYLVVNADGSEPGTFKDRELMEVESQSLREA